MSTDIQAQLSAAVQARKGSLRSLRERIDTLLSPIPVGVALRDDEGLVCTVARVATGASQWSNATWLVAIRGRGYLSPGGKLLASSLSDDESLWDGKNQHYRTTEPIVLAKHAEWGPCDHGLAFEPGKITRELARRLPRAIENYMADCSMERAANDATLPAN